MKNDMLTRMKGLRILSKYGIVLLSALMTLHCGMLWCGIDLMYLHLLTVVYMVAVGVFLSFVFRLCIAHKLCVIYIGIVLMCIVLRRHDKFPDTEILQLARQCMCVAGVIITGWSLWMATRKKI